jgi:membrane protease YdiL (CAAX protease family)
VLGFLMAYPLLILAEAGLNWLYSLRHYQMTDHPVIQAMKMEPALWRDVLLCVTAGVIAPVAEEIFFRGLLQTALIQRGWGLLVPQGLSGATDRGYAPSAVHRWGAILLASAAFAAVHQADQMPIIFVLAVALGYVYERTGNLWAAIFLHMAFNGLNLTMFIRSRGG